MGMVLKTAWALFLGVALLMLGNGLQSSLLGVRAGIEGFADAETGLIMAGFYTGFLAGSLLVPDLVRRVGHVRVFAALASLSSAAILLHAILGDPFAWTIVRFASGFCFAGLFVVAESWLNDRATNDTRGQILAFYMVVTTGMMAAGQFLLNSFDPAGFELFVMVSVLISISLVPMLLSAAAAPAFDAPAPLKFAKLIRVSQSGVVGTFFTGISHAAIVAMGAVYATRIGLGVAEIALFMAVLLSGAVIFQLPMGRLSDRMDRRLVILGLALAAGGASLALPWDDGAPLWRALVAAALLGGAAMPIYSICVAYTNDYLDPSEMVGASSALYMVYGVGAILGPLAAGAAMSLAGAFGYVAFLAAAHGALAVFVLVRINIRDSLPVEDQTAYAPVPFDGSQLAVRLNPEAEYDEEAGEPVEGGPLFEYAPEEPAEPAAAEPRDEGEKAGEAGRIGA